MLYTTRHVLDVWDVPHGRSLYHRAGVARLQGRRAGGGGGLLDYAGKAKPLPARSEIGEGREGARGR